MPRLVLILMVAALAACAPRASLAPAPAGTEDLPTRSVFVATTRAVEQGHFGSARAQAPSYLRIDLTVPPDRARGAIPAKRHEVDPHTQFLARKAVIYPGDGAFRSELGAALRQDPEREAVIYVHGFNNTLDEGILRIAQLSEDFGLEGVAVHYSWPSAAKVFGYAYDRDSVLFARDGLDRLIGDVKAAGAQRVIIVAHSMGAQLLMEVLRERALRREGSVAREIDGVVLMSPDIDLDVFRAQARSIGELPAPFAIFVSKTDRALALSARLTGQKNRLGNASAGDVADLEVVLLDVTGFSRGAGHFTLGDSPALISIFANANYLDAAFASDSAGRTGLLPGTVLTVQNATEIILSPITGFLD